MYNADAPFASVENYKVSVGQGEDGPWAIESDWVTGGNSVEVTWDW